MPGLAKEATIDFGIRGVDPEPRNGYKLTKTRNEHLQAFSNAAWQRHEAHHLGQSGPSTQWPSSVAFHSNWPLLADALVIASWKLDGAAAADLPLVDEGDHELLDPKPPPEVDWHDTYALDLSASPGVMQDLNKRVDDGVGDGIERVLERAQLSAGERAVMRAWLYTPDLVTVTEDLEWSSVRVGALYRNASERLRWLGQNPATSNAPRGEPGVFTRARSDVFSRNGHHVRARTPDVSVTVGARKRDNAQSRAS